EQEERGERRPRVVEPGHDAAGGQRLLSVQRGRRDVAQQVLDAVDGEAGGLQRRPQRLHLPGVPGRRGRRGHPRHPASRYSVTEACAVVARAVSTSETARVIAEATAWSSSASMSSNAPTALSR